MLVFRAFLPALILPALLSALDNSKTIHNLTSTPLTSHPFTLSVYFAQGEIPTFAEPNLTPSDGGTRAAATAWQNDVKTRWRDGIVSRAITEVRTGPPTWTGGSGLTNIVVSAGNLGSGTGTITFASPHRLTVGDRLMITGAVSDADLNQDNYMVMTVPSPTSVTIRTRNASAATYSPFGNNAALTVMHVLDPLGRTLCRFVSPDHGFQVGEQVLVAGLPDISGLDPTTSYYVIAASQNEFQINASCGGSYAGGGGAVKGPDWGSLRFSLISFQATVPAAGSLRVDFVPNPNPSSAGDAAATVAAGLDKAGMLSFRDSSPGAGDGWNIQLDVGANVKFGATPAYSVSARSILGSWNGTQTYCGPRYWLRGPVVTQLILEDSCDGSVSLSGGQEAALRYDVGWKPRPGASVVTPITSITQTSFDVDTTENLSVGSRLWFKIDSATKEEWMTVTDITGNTVTVMRGSNGSSLSTYAVGKAFGVLQWEDPSDTGFKSLHPSFLLTFYSGWGGVKTEVKVANTWWNKIQSLWYSAEIKTGPGSATARITKPEMKHPNGSYWYKSMWDGADPEHFCSGSGPDPENCASGVRSMRYRVDHNTKYLIYAGALPTWRQYPNQTTSIWWENPTRGGQGYGFSDQADIGVERAGRPGRYLGQGTWGAASVTSSTAYRDFQNGTQEGGLLDLTQALFAQDGNWDTLGYDIMFGERLPGGGGNSATSGYIPWHHWDGESGYGTLAFGYPGNAFGRVIGIHNRPSVSMVSPGNFSINVSLAADQPKTACFTTSNAQLSSRVSTTGGSWPCWPDTQLQGMDNWNYERAHQNDWYYLPYLMTGHYWLLQGMYGQAAWNAGSAHALRNTGKSWGFGQNADLIRHDSWWTLLIERAAAMSPTELQFGETARPEREYFTSLLWDEALIEEGIMNIQDGWAATFYGPLFNTDCTGYSSALSNLRSIDRWQYGRCGFWTAATSNPLHQVSLVPTGSNNQPYLNPNIITSGTENWMLGYSQNVWAHAAELQLPMFGRMFSLNGQFLVSLIMNKFMNPFTIGLFNSPYRFRPDGHLANSYEELATGWSAVGANIRDFLDANFTSTTAPTGYGPQILGTLSFLIDVSDSVSPGCTPDDRPPAGCTGEGAYAWMKQVLPRQSDLRSTPKYNFIPRTQPIILAADRSSVTMRIRGGHDIWWTDACSYAINPTNSLDDSDTPIPAGSQVRTFSFAAQPGDRLRITCGTGRVTMWVP